MWPGCGVRACKNWWISNIQQSFSRSHQVNVDDCGVSDVSQTLSSFVNGTSACLFSWARVSWGFCSTLRIFSFTVILLVKSRDHAYGLWWERNVNELLFQATAFRHILKCCFDQRQSCQTPNQTGSRPRDVILYLAIKLLTDTGDSSIFETKVVFPRLSRMTEYRPLIWRMKSHHYFSFAVFACLFPEWGFHRFLLLCSQSMDPNGSVFERVFDHLRLHLVKANVQTNVMFYEHRWSIGIEKFCCNFWWPSNDQAVIPCQILF